MARWNRHDFIHGADGESLSNSFENSESHLSAAESGVQGARVWAKSYPQQLGGAKGVGSHASFHGGVLRLVLRT